MRNQLSIALSAIMMAFALTAAPAGAAQKKAAAKPAAAAPAAPATGNAASAAPTNPDQPKVKVERGASGKKIYRITEEIRIEGKIQKPEAFFFYQKSAINYDWDELKNPFRAKILESVEHAPF